MPPYRGLREDKKWDKQKQEDRGAQDQIVRILTLDPDRLEYEKQQDQNRDFDYATAVDKFAKLWKIPSSNYSLQDRREIKRRGRKSKSANLTIKPIDIERVAQFLSTILVPWPDLQCDILTLTKLPDGPDVWKADVKFTYYY